MDRFWKYLLALSWLFYLLLSSVSVFLSGFLLNRDVLSNRSSCVDVRNLNRPVNVNLNTEQLCTMPRSRIVLMIIDALMYDFALYNDSLATESSQYENKMPIFSQLRSKKRSHTLLYKFVADPPTTTMQRLKGLTTGSLPTFIDAGSNFASAEIDEDNFLDQLKSHNRNIVFMGDDTWNSLYPNRFLRAFPFPSFNVWDLDTVDRGIEMNLVPELKKKDWDLLVAHFLGVDHCGHRYGPNHPEMSRKLTEMNTIIRQTVDNLDNDTMLVVIGDHGMTATGNHGGDSLAEVTAALFIYSPHPLLRGKLESGVDSVNQVDLVPTLSAILGSPIPFSSLGSLIAEALPHGAKDWRSVSRTVMNNVNQVHKYVDTYWHTAQQFTEENVASLKREHQKLQQSFLNVKSLDDFKLFLPEARSYFKNVKSMCEEIWVQFDIIFMVIGLIFMIMSIMVGTIIIQNIPSQKMFTILDSKVSVFAVIVVFVGSLLTWLIFNIFLITFCFLSLSLSIALIFNNISHAQNGLKAQIKHADWISFVTLLLVIGNLVGMFSNSYVVEEAMVVSFWTVTLVAALVPAWQKETWTGKDKKNSYVRPWLPLSLERLVLVFLVCLLCVFIRLLSSFWQCREEQSWCQDLSATVTKSDVLSKVPVIALPALAIWYWLRKCGNLVGITATVTVIKFVPMLVTALSFLYWVLESLPNKVLIKLITWNIQVIPQIVYFLLTIAVLCLVNRPLCVHVVPPRKKDNLYLEGGKNLLPHIFQHIKSALNEDKGAKKVNNIPAVYGLPTVFSASFLAVTLLLLQLLSLLQGSKFAPALVIVFFASVLLLVALGISRLHTAVLPPQILCVPMYAISAWGFLCVTSFYGTGHQATVPSIQWQAAFVGTSGEFNSYLLPGMMVTASTFSAHILLGVTLPLLMVVPLTLLATSPSNLFIHHDVKRTVTNGEMFIFEHSTLASHAAFMLSAKYTLFLALRVCAAMATALLHRRHLMVWKIFAPKLIFEAASLGVSIMAVLIGFLLFSLLSHRLDGFMVKLQKDQQDD